EDGLGKPRPLTHHAECVADGEESRALVVEDAIEQPVERRLPRRILADALTAGGGAVVGVRIEMARTPRAEVEGEASARRLGDHPGAAHVERPRPGANRPLLDGR